MSDMDAAEVEDHGYRVIITRSAGADGAVVIFVDGGEGDGSPGCRIRLNDEPVYEGTPYTPID